MRNKSYLTIGAFLLGVAFLIYRHYYPPPPESFSAAKTMLETRIYSDYPYTLYCGAQFDEDKSITHEKGFMASDYSQRANRLEWEHAVPVENFGRTFEEWRTGHPDCERNGKPFKGRKCAELINKEFRKMEADMYNLFPAIGAVNAARGHRPYAELPSEPPAFGSCAVKIASGAFEPPDRAKGQVARASLYMDAQYSRLHLSRKQRQLFAAWNKRFPVDKGECERARLIERIQGNANMFIKDQCLAKGWY